METQTSDTRGTFSNEGRIFESLDHVKFDELAKFVNGIKIMALANAEDVIPQHQDLFKLRISDPVGKLL